MKLKKYLVFNPNGNKPKRYFAKYNTALDICQELNQKTGEEFLVLQVIASVETKKEKQVIKII